MRVISRKALKLFAGLHADAWVPLDQWCRITRRASWRNLADVKQDFNHAESVGRHTVFNIKGNSYRLIARVNYRTGRVFIRHVMTHEEYDRGAWKR